MATPEARLNKVLEKLEKAVYDRQEQVQREEYAYMQMIAEREEEARLRYEQEMRELKRGQDSHNQREQGRMKRKGLSLWGSL